MQEVIAKSPDIVIYETNHSKGVEDAYKRYVELLNA